LIFDVSFTVFLLLRSIACALDDASFCAGDFRLAYEYSPQKPLKAQHATLTPLARQSLIVTLSAQAS
jgi:hypothetical protein